MTQRNRLGKIARTWLENSPGPSAMMPTDEEVSALTTLLEQTEEAARAPLLDLLSETLERRQAASSGSSPKT